MFAQLRSGQKRIVLASTSKLGTGANIQTKLAALHNLDIPWKPSDLEQRNGRIIRQGNTFGKVNVFNYVTENSLLVSMAGLKPNSIKKIADSGMKMLSCVDNDEAGIKFTRQNNLLSCRKILEEKGVKDWNDLLKQTVEKIEKSEQKSQDKTARSGEKSEQNFSKKSSHSHR